MRDAPGVRRSALASILAGTAALAAPAPVHAAVFVVLASTPDAITVLDPAAITTVDKTQVRRAWTVSVKRVLTEGGPQQPGYVRTLSEYDCQAWQIRWRGFQAYSRFGDLVMKQDNPDNAWKPAPDVGQDAAAMRAVCTGAIGASAISAGSLSQLVLSLMQAWDPPGASAPAQAPQPKARTARPKRPRAKA